MELRAAEISAILKQKIIDYDTKTEVSESGRVLSMSDGIARVYGLDNIQAGELVQHEGQGGAERPVQRVHDRNALVLINESATSYADLAAAREDIIQAVYDKFRIQIEQEPLEVK